MALPTCASCSATIPRDATVTFTSGGRETHYHAGCAPAEAPRGDVVDARKRSRLTLGLGTVNEDHTRILRASKLRAKSDGDFGGAILQAGYYAKKTGQTMHVYAGNSYMHAVWRVSSKPSDYLDPVNNTGKVVIAVSPNLTVTRYPVERPA